MLGVSILIRSDIDAAFDFIRCFQIEFAGFAASAADGGAEAKPGESGLATVSPVFCAGSTDCETCGVSGGNNTNQPRITRKLSAVANIKFLL